MRCPYCDNHILQKSGKTTRLRIKGQVIFEEGLCKAQCYWCKATIEIPLEIREGTPIKQESFVLSKP
jgi:hypothetical protein